MHGSAAGVYCSLLLPGEFYDGLEVGQEAHGVASGSKEGICMNVGLVGMVWIFMAVFRNLVISSRMQAMNNGMRLLCRVNNLLMHLLCETAEVSPAYLTITTVQLKFHCRFCAMLYLLWPMVFRKVYSKKYCRKT